MLEGKILLTVSFELFPSILTTFCEATGTFVLLVTVRLQGKREYGRS